MDAGAMDSLRLAVVPRAHSLTSMPKTSQASRSWITRLVLLAEVVPCLEEGLPDGEGPGTAEAAMRNAVEEEVPPEPGVEVRSAEEGGDGEIGRRSSHRYCVLYGG